MDFNTGTSSDSRPRRPGEAWFDYSDPLRSFLTTFPRVLFPPRAFFRDISYRRGFVNPLIFAATCTLIGAIFSGVFGVLTRGVPGMQFLATETGLLFDVIYAFVYGMIGLVIITGVYHLLVLLLARANNAGLEGTFRVVSYAYAVQVLGWVPLLNVLVGLYGLYLCAFGFQEVHSTTYQRAATIAALPLLLLIVLGSLFGILLGFLLSAA